MSRKFSPKTPRIRTQPDLSRITSAFPQQYFVSDPPGSLQLQPSYPLALPKSSTSTSTPLTQTLILESFQLCPSDNWAKVGARSHSWNGLLTLALNFNYVRNPREEMHRLLEEWAAVLERIVVGAEKS